MSELLVFVTEPTGQMLWTNPALERVTGFTLAEFQFPNPDNPFLHPEDAEHVVAFLSDFAGSDDAVSGELTNRFIAKWGEVLTVVSRVHRVDWEGTPAFRVEAWLSAEMSDVPAEEQSAALYRALVEASPDGIARLDGHGRHYYSNPRLWELVGRDAVGLKRCAFHEVFHEDDEARVREAIGAVAATGARTEIEVMLRSADERSMELRLRLIEGVRDAGVVHVLVRETTVQRKLEARLLHTQKLESLGLLAGGIAHDFNNLLTSIIGNVSVIDQRPGAEVERECLRDVRLAAEHGAALTRSMLAYSGRAPVQLACVDLGATLVELVPLVRAASESKVRIVVSTKELPGVYGDEAQLTQVMLNLLTNAADALGPGGGKVFVETRRVDDAAWADGCVWPIGRPSGTGNVCVSVRDEGSGIDNETLGRMFDPFFSTKGQGRGLGLSSVLGILRAHGGVVGIEANEPQGTCIHVVLPPSRGADAKLEEERETGSPVAGGGVVLFVDDQQALRAVGSKILSRAGYEVVLAASGQDALEQLEQHPGFVAVVLDESMPSMSGAMVLRALRSSHPTLPVLRTSGYSLETVQNHRRTAFLAKPYNAEELVGALRGLLGTSEAA